MSGVHTLVVKSDQEVSIVDVKNSLICYLRGVEGLTVMPEESPVCASAADSLIARSVLEMPSTTRALIAYAERVHETKFDFGSAILTWTVKFSGQAVSRFQRSEENQRKSAGSFQCTSDVHADGEPKEKGEVRNRACWQGSEVMPGTRRVAEARRGHNPAEAAEGEPLGMAMARSVSVLMVPVEDRPDVPVIGAEGIQSPPVGHLPRSGAREVWILRSL